MWLEGIVARALEAGNATHGSWPLRVFVQAWRRGGVVRTGLMLVFCGLLLAGVPMPFDGMLIPIAMLFIGEAELSLHTSSSRLVPHRLIRWRLLNTLLAAITLTLVTGEDWVATAAFGLFVVSCSGIVGGRGLARITVIAGVANIVLPMAIHWWMRVPVSAPGSKALLISGVIFPAAALLLHLRSHRLLLAQHRLSETVADLEGAQSNLRASEQRLQQWNEQLNASIVAQTTQLEERNRYLSIINAVSFALAEPMDDFRSLERAARLIARLMGARGAQAFQRAGVGDTAHLFVTVAPEDVHAPRLPDALLRRVAETGAPVISTATGEDEAGLPDLGEPYAVVPIVARGQVCGAFAILGTGGIAWGDQERHLLLLVGREMGVAMENMRLYREAIERVEREETAAGAARLLDLPQRREEAVHQALDLVGRALGAHDIALVTLDEARRSATLYSAVRAMPEDGDWLQAFLSSIPGTVGDRQEAIILGAGGDAPLSETVEGYGIGTVALVPVISTRGSSVLPRRDAGGRAVEPLAFQRTLSGVIVVAAAAGVPWRPAATELAARFAYSLARRLESDELAALQQQRIRELSGLADVARTMQSGADVDRLYAGFAHALTGLLQYARLYIARVDEYGLPGAAPSFAPDGARDDRALGDADVAHRWFGLRAATSWHAGMGAPPSFVSGGDERWLVVPMRPKGQVLGVVAFAVAEDVSGDQLRIVEQAVEQLALALDSATLYHQATERASHIQALSNLARIVASVVDLREAFAAFAEEVRWLIPFDRAVMLLLDDSEAEVQPYATYPEESLRTVASPLVESIACAPMDASGAVFLRRSDPAYAGLDWDILGPDVAEVAAVPVRNGVRTAAIFALVHTTPTAGAPDLNALEEVAGLLGVTIERLRLYERAEHSANHDLLTGLPNYRYLQERLYDLHAGISAPGESSVLMVDMDGLKLFNDTLGHEAGDQVIRIVARELRSTCRAEDVVARTGGDEFVVVMEGVGLADAAHVAERIHAALREGHLEIPGAPARIGVSIGIATAPQDARSAGGLLHAADQAMYGAKFSGGHRTRLAHDHDEDSPTRSIPQRDTHIVETLVRTAIDGATGEERSLIVIAQRWVVGVVAHLDGGVEAAPWARMIVAAEALSTVGHMRHGPDQEMARYFLDRLRREWSGRRDEVALATLELAPMAVRLARAQAPASDASGQLLAQAVSALRQELGERVIDLHESLFAFALADRLDRRREREAA
ncbi:MAG: diguanylate cyclase [Dehalococcoidia bacterium]